MKDIAETIIEFKNVQEKIHDYRNEEVLLVVECIVFKKDTFISDSAFYLSNIDVVSFLDRLSNHLKELHILDNINYLDILKTKMYPIEDSVANGLMYTEGCKIQFNMRLESV